MAPAPQSSAASRVATPTQPKQFPIGFDYVIVNGQVAVDSGKHTRMLLAGPALRRGRESPVRREALGSPDELVLMRRQVLAAH